MCRFPMGATDNEVKKALRQAIEPVTGDAVFVERWETATDAQGNLDLEDLGAPLRADAHPMAVLASKTQRKTMFRRRKLLVAAAGAFLRCRLRIAGRRRSCSSVLHQLDVAAANFRTTPADFEFDSIQTDPIPDKDVQKGVVYYERKGTTFQMAAHITR